MVLVFQAPGQGLPKDEGAVSRESIIDREGTRKHRKAMVPFIPKEYRLGRFPGLRDCKNPGGGGP